MPSLEIRGFNPDRLIRKAERFLVLFSILKSELNKELPDDYQGPLIEPPARRIDEPKGLVIGRPTLDFVRAEKRKYDRAYGLNIVTNSAKAEMDRLKEPGEVLKISIQAEIKKVWALKEFQTYVSQHPETGEIMKKGDEIKKLRERAVKAGQEISAMRSRQSDILDVRVLVGFGTRIYVEAVEDLRLDEQISFLESQRDELKKAIDADKKKLLKLIKFESNSTIGARIEQNVAKKREVDHNLARGTHEKDRRRSVNREESRLGGVITDLGLKDKFVGNTYTLGVLFDELEGSIKEIQERKLTPQEQALLDTHAQLRREARESGAAV